MNEILQDFISDLILLLIGGVLIQYGIHQYQKGKDIKETRESLLTLHSKSSHVYETIIKNWNKWVRSFNPNLSKEKSEQQKTNAQNAIEDLCLDFEITTRILFGKLVVYFKYTKTEEEFFNQISGKFIDIKNLINELINSEEIIEKLEEKLLQEVDKMNKYLGKLLIHILRAKPK